MFEELKAWLTVCADSYSKLANITSARSDNYGVYIGMLKMADAVLEKIQELEELEKNHDNS